MIIVDLRVADSDKSFFFNIRPIPITDSKVGYALQSTNQRPLDTASYKKINQSENLRPCKLQIINQSE